MLVSQLNGNPFLSKDRLTRVRNSIYFNNADEYLSAANSSSTCLLGLESDYAIYMMQRSTTRGSSVLRAAGKRGQLRKNVAGPSNIYNGIDEGCWWLGRVQKIRRKIGSRWGNSKVPVDLMNRPVGRNSATGPTYQVRLNWFSKSSGNLKFKYDHSDCKWVDVDSIISTVTLTFLSGPKLYSMDSEDFASLEEFVQNAK
jgi:hypothetical protein